MVIGPLIGLLLITHLGSDSLFLFLTGLALAACVAVSYKKLPEDAVKKSPHTKRGLSLSDFMEKRALPMAVIGGLVFFAYGGMLTFIPLYTKELSMDFATSWFFMAFALIIVVTRPMVGHVFDRRGPSWTVYPGFALFLAGFFVFSQVSSIGTLLLSALLLGSGFGALSPAFQTLAMQCAPSDRTGVASATYFWAQDISVGLAAVMLGAAATAMGYPFMYGVLCPLAVLLALVLYFLWRKTGSKRKGHTNPYK